MLGITKKVSNNGVEVFQEIDSMIQGGFTLDTSNLSALVLTVGGAVIPAGSMVAFNEATRLVQVVKSATIQSASQAGDLTLKVMKNSCFQAGDFLANSVGGTAVTVVSVDSVGSLAFDALLLSAPLNVAIPSFGVVFGALAAGASAAFSLTPNGITDKGYSARAGQDLAVVGEGRVYARRTMGVPPEARVAMPRITFSDSK